jgi:spore coat polysaccharide biosynthesis protein SpsF
MKTIAIIQARFNSTRLKGKVLMELGGKTVLANCIARLQRCKELTDIVVATSTEPEDKAVIAEAIKNGVGHFAGSHLNVLDRYHSCAEACDADRIVRITADCPYIMPDVVNRVISESKIYDYGSNVITRTYPKGLDCEVFSFGELDRAWRLADNNDEREHVTPYIIKNVCGKKSIKDTQDFSSKRLTLDTIQDYQDLQRYYPIIGSIYNYDDCKKVLNKCISSEDMDVSQEFGRV